jgi:hypothetical protein
MNKLVTITTIATTVIAIAGPTVTISLYRHFDQAAYIPQMSVACEHHQPDCQSLITKVQSGGRYEVLADTEGHYWAESK